MILVVQIDPGPIPTLTPSAPAFTRKSAASAVAIFPTTTSSSGKSFLIFFKIFKTPLECPWAVSITIASIPASYKALHLNKESLETPIAAATFNRPNLSLFDIGLRDNFWISLNVIKPTKFLFLSITGNFSILCFCKISSASPIVTPSFAVIKLAVVITSERDLLFSFSNLKSLLVTIPINLFSLLIIGIPPILYSFIHCLASKTNASFFKVTGFRIIPDSDLLTFFTLLACSSIDMLLWRTPNPPSWAIAIAILLSVTVSIAAETIGIFKFIFLENLDFKSTSLGRNSE